MLSQSQMSGQISGQVPNQAGSQLPILHQHNDGSMASQMQSVGGGRNTGNMDNEIELGRRIIREKIYQLLQQQQRNTTTEMQPRMTDIVHRLEERLFKNAKTKEDFLDMSTIENRLQIVVRSMRAGNHSQQLPQHNSSSSSVGTMIPTPGMQNTGNFNSPITSNVANSTITSSGNVALNTVNSGQLLSNAMGSRHGGSFNASTGPISNGYDQSSANVSFRSGMNNMMSSGVGMNNMMSSGVLRRSGSQMIPTPGLNTTQSSANSESSNNGGGFSGVESTMASHLQQPKQNIGGQNNHKLQCLGGQMGIGMRSTTQQKPSSYGFSNGALNGGTGLIGNNVSLMNRSSSDSYLTASPYGNSPKPFHQHFDQQRQQQLIPNALPQQMISMLGDGYGMNGSDLSESGNLYGTAASVVSSMDNQNLNPVSLPSNSKNNSSLMTDQGNLHAAHVKPQMVDSNAKMNFQTPQQLQKLQQQQFQQNHQFQQQQLVQQQHQQHQLVQHQHQQKQQNHQHQQLLLKNDGLRQSHIAPNLVGSQGMAEQAMEPHNDFLHSQISDQFQLSELQNQFQQNAAPEDQYRGAQMLCHTSGTENYGFTIPQGAQNLQHMLHPHHQVSESQNNFSCFSGGTQPESLPQGQWHLQSQENLSSLSSQEQHIQHEFHQRIIDQDEAQRPHLSSEGSITTHAATSRSTAVPPTSGVASCARGNATRERQYVDQLRWMLFLIHARRCSAPEGKCPEANCITMQKLVKHMGTCNIHQCTYPRCGKSKRLYYHLRSCKAPDCPFCIPLHRYIEQAKRKASARPPSDTILPNSMNGAWKSLHVGDTARLMSKTSPATVESSHDYQSSLKRMKMEHPSPSLTSKNDCSPVSVPAVTQTHVSHDEQSQVCQLVEMPIAALPKVMEVKTEQSISQTNPNFIEIKKDESDDAYLMRHDVEPINQNDPGALAKLKSMKVEKENIQAMQEPPAQPTEPAAGKSGKPKVKGVSLTELFTPEQIREHITGLRQWVGQSKAKAEKNQAMEHSMSENSCQLCAVEKLTFEPPPIYCTPCGARIKRNAPFYTVGSGDTRHCFCIPCYNEARGDTIEVDGSGIAKMKLEKKRNDEETEEWWVQCDKCEAWQHQICALFNGRRNDGGQAEYTCPNCYIAEIERGERKPLPQSAVLGAKDLPTTILSDHIEQRLFRRLKQEQQDRARLQGKSIDEVPGAESLVVRVVSSVDKKLEVKQRFLEIFQEENYPSEFPYKSKVVLLFQKIEGVEVCLFGMYVQEFGAECQYPNQRRVYLSYLDSVKYFRPDIRTVSGEALRTFVYHEILIGYLEYCKKRGFTSCYIWACPPLKGEDYILYCHPEIQKTPKSDKLREWYLSMLRKATKENIVAELTNLYDHFFVSNGECKAKVTAARLPYFDGDYWPGAAEDMINQLRQEEDGRKQQKKGKTKKTITKRALKAAGHTDLSANASKDALLMQKLGETIFPMKEDFIMVHLQHACIHCCHLLVSGNRWVCKQCKSFQLCDKCYEAEQKLDDRDKHPINSRDKHTLYPVEVRDVPSDTKDRDEILESEFFDTRQAFLSLCQGNHYQYDTLRRAKHSSMMVLYHLHNPTAPAFVTTCNICHQDIEAGQGWRCETCSDYDVCNACYSKDGGVDHPHKLTNSPSMADRDAQNTEARQKRVLQLRKMLDLLVHASQCRLSQCQYPNCRKVKGLFRHGIQCKRRASGGCGLCKKMWYLLQLHARACKESVCGVPRCKDLKEHLKRLQQQSDSRRRAAVMEMMRQRAAEVAVNTG